jgi:hypothetical protein
MTVELAASAARCGKMAQEEESFFFLAAVFVRAVGPN